MAAPNGSFGVACAFSGRVNMPASTMTVPNRSTAEAKPAAACNRKGPKVFLQARFKAWKRGWRRRARSWLMATRMRNNRFSGSGTGPSAASKDCISSRDFQSPAHSLQLSTWAATRCISRPLRRPSRYSVNLVCIALQPFIAPPLRGAFHIPRAREDTRSATEPSESLSRPHAHAPAAT